MAEEGGENRAGDMDLNLYLGLPRSPRPRSLDLGSDLALSSLPLSASSNSEESRAPEAVSAAAMEASASNAPYSPSHAAIVDADALLAGFRAPADANPSHDYATCFASYEPYVTEGQSMPYSPSIAQTVPIGHEFGETDERDGVAPTAFDDGSPVDSYAEGSGSHPPYSPPYLAAENVHEEERFMPFSSIPLQIGGSFAAQGDGPSSQQELLRSPEFRIRRLIESHQYRLRRFRTSLSYGNERSNFVQPPPSPNPTELMQDIMNSQRSLETNGKHKVGFEVVNAESSEEDVDLKKKNSANFECNICFDVAKEPVVTSCGHLFCWSCLYQWLHVHSDNKECPVCKGEVTEANIVPIYGRGSSGLDAEKTDTANLDSDLKIPPRPRGNRLESWRQHLRPITRRFGEGITNSWRRLLNHQMRNRSRFGGHEEALVQEMLNGGSHAVLTRSMARRLHRDESTAANVPSADDVRFSRDSSSIPSLVFPEGNDIWQRLYGFSGSDRLAAVSADIGRAVGRFASNSNRYGPSTSSINASNTEHFSGRRSAGATATADQASASSTVAVIQGESSARAASAEPNSAGSSRPYRRRGRSNASGSLDVDGGGALHARKRRRIN